MKQLKTVFLVLTKGCNLECSYCYEKEFNNNVKLMSLDTFRKILSKFDEDINLDLFGGEPLMNKIIIDFIISNFDKLNIDKLTISTNGVLIDNNIVSFYNKFLGRVNFIISIDSNKECHDNHRLDKVGRGTYDIIMKNITNIVDKSFIQLNCCITPYSADKFYYGIINLIRLNFKKFKIIIIYELNWDNEKIINLVNNLRKLNLFINIKKDIYINFFSNLNLEDTIDCKLDMLSKYRFNYNGDMIPCTLFLSDFKYKINFNAPNIYDDNFNLNLRENHIIKYFFENNYNNKTICDFYSNNIYKKNKEKINILLKNNL